MQGCCHCQGRFGMVSHRFLFKRFCSRQCLGLHRRNLVTAMEERASRWCSVLLTSFTFGKFRMSDEGATVPSRYAAIRHGDMRRHR
jgi:hypothetical protein